MTFESYVLATKQGRFPQFQLLLIIVSSAMRGLNPLLYIFFLTKTVLSISMKIISWILGMRMGRWATFNLIQFFFIRGGKGVQKVTLPTVTIQILPILMKFKPYVLETI